ncbi:MAG: tetratricopeptide repeat protein [Chloroflexota bacterium]
MKRAAASLASALEQQPGNLRAWVQLAEVYREIERYPEALDALQQARALNANGQFPTTEMDFIEARIRAGLGETDAAQELANQALLTADSDLAAQINAFLDELNGSAE